MDPAAVRELAAAGRYGDLSAALRNGRLGPGSGVPGKDALVLAAVQLCASGTECRSEADFHARACAAAVERERELQRHLTHLLDLMAGSVPSGERAPVYGPQSGDGADLVAFCLGPFRLYQRGEAVADWNGSKSLSVLRYLLLHRRSRIPKEVLMDTIWPGSDADAARRNLHQAVYSLRRALRRGHGGPRHVCFADDCYFLDPGLSLWLDYEEFEKRARRAESLEREGHRQEAAEELAAAERLYGGDLFEDRPYDEWIIGERDRLRALYHWVASRLSDHHVEGGAHDAAIALSQRLLSEDPCDEGSHRRLIACYLAQGRRGLAAQQYRACEAALRSELGAEPSPETLALRPLCLLSPD
jgi:DNA-binding SARP family transcriptional activator